nr:hypothetical protein [Tanacetum cinerariifolium]
MLMGLLHVKAYGQALESLRTKIVPYADCSSHVTNSCFVCRYLKEYGLRGGVEIVVATPGRFIDMNSRNFEASCSAYIARSCNRVILPLEVLNESRVITLCYFNDSTIARRVAVSYSTDAKLAHTISTSSPTDSTRFGGGGGSGTAGGGKDDNGKSDGGGTTDVEAIWVWSDSTVSIESSPGESSSKKSDPKSESDD